MCFNEYSRPGIMNINSNEPLFYLDRIIVNKCSGSCNNINDSYAKLYVTDVVKNMNMNVFNLMSRINETRHGIMINADVNPKN